MTEPRETDSAIRQAGAIPFRRCDGRIEVLLITNSARTHWIVPKGNLEAGLTPAEAAAREAWEEGGVTGEIAPRSIGSYSYTKERRRYTVELHPLHVAETRDVWPEMSCRQRRWVTVNEALRRIRADELAHTILELRDRLERRHVA